VRDARHRLNPLLLPLLPADARPSGGWLDLLIPAIAKRVAAARGTGAPPCVPRPMVNGDDRSGRGEEKARVGNASTAAAPVRFSMPR
jgi:hypothetical protein